MEYLQQPNGKIASFSRTSMTFGTLNQTSEEFQDKMADVYEKPLLHVRPVWDFLERLSDVCRIEERNGPPSSGPTWRDVMEETFI